MFDRQSCVFNDGTKSYYNHSMNQGLIIEETPLMVKQGSDSEDEEEHAKADP